jgi:hypothetical protein
MWQDSWLEPRRHRRIFGRMSDQRPTFAARKNPGSGWGVDILWPDGETEVIKGFITEYDAVKWIMEHEHRKAWQENTNDRSRQAPQDDGLE